MAAGVPGGGERAGVPADCGGAAAGRPAHRLRRGGSEPRAQGAAHPGAGLLLSTVPGLD